MQMESVLKQFEIPKVLSINKSENGLNKVTIVNNLAEAEIYLHGAHLTHFQPKGEEPMIFDGKESYITPPKSVHAGIPICWPWFGTHPTDDNKPQHGFARDLLWQIKSTRTLDSEETEIVLTLQENSHTKTLFLYDFALELTFTIGQRLTVALKSTNTDKSPITITQALHSYFAVSDIEAVSISGVEETPFVDYTDNRTEKREEHSLKIDREVNRVYIPTDSACTITDNVLDRKIVIEKSGSRSTTIWNPWQNSGLHDLPAYKYRKFVCIETTNALQDAVTLQPNESHRLVQRISIERL